MSISSPLNSELDLRAKGKMLIFGLSLPYDQRDVLAEIMAGNITSAEQALQYAEHYYPKNRSEELLTASNIKALFAEVVPSVQRYLPECIPLNVDLGSQQRLEFYFG